jgi:hypothetical protein
MSARASSLPHTVQELQEQLAKGAPRNLDELNILYNRLFGAWSQVDMGHYYIAKGDASEDLELYSQLIALYNELLSLYDNSSMPHTREPLNRPGIAK